VELKNDLRRIEEILNSKIFEVENSMHVLRESAFIEVMIRARDALEKLKIANRSIGLEIMSETVWDSDSGLEELSVYCVIKWVRDAMCHVESDNNLVAENVFSFNVVYGKGVFMGEMKSDYADDVAFFFGPVRLYLNRHLRTLTTKMIEEEKAV
jgi:hypothetical protein